MSLFIVFKGTLISSSNQLVLSKEEVAIQLIALPGLL